MTPVVTLEDVRNLIDTATRQDGEPALWQYRWLNPMGFRCHPNDMAWRFLEVSSGCTIEEEILTQLNTTSSTGLPMYAVRPLFVAPFIDYETTARDFQ